MLRMVCVLASAVFVASASADVTCDPGSLICLSCVAVAGSNVCVNYTFPADPVCVLCLDPCPKTTCTSNCDAQCGACVRTGLAGLGVCLSATVGTGLYVTSQNAFDAGLNLAILTNLQLQSITAQSNGSVSGNAVVSLDGSPIPRLVVGSDSGSGAIFEVNSSVTVNSWINNAGSARVDNNCGVLVVGNLSVGGSSFSVFQSCPQAVVTLPMIDFSARAAFTAPSTLHIAGGVAHVGAHGTTSGSVVGTGTVKLSGGVSVDGTIPSTVTLHVASSGRSAPLAVVDVSKILKTSGNVEGDGTIVVNGNFEISVAAKIDPKVVVNAAATFLIDSAAAFKARTVEVAAGAFLVVGASANKGTVTIENIAKCLGTVRINLATSAAVFISGDRAGAGVALKYSSKPADLKNCAVEIVDSEKRTFTLTSSTSAAAGRRLLASSGTANWGPNEMTYTMNQNATQNAAPLSFALLPIVVTSVIGMLI